MCIFTGDVQKVAGTKIFARIEHHQQYLAYEMSFSAEKPLAMVLPLPIPPGKTDAVRFIDLEPYPSFFEKLKQLFPAPASFGSADLAAASASLDLPQLEVHEVGSFEASFVPTRADFARLDPRFRLPERIWNDLPRYQDYGFAVFQLRAGSSKVHPMALAFISRDPRSIFFPTVHVHDSEVRSEAHFDHLLYCQQDERDSLPGWTKGGRTPDWLEWERPMDTTDVEVEMDASDELSLLPPALLEEQPLIEPPEVLAPRVACFKRSMQGMAPNRDVQVALPPVG